ncbi:MAG: DnaJ domain-containing protein [Alphaproteobacteria bacterium]|nr:DnaJ domain-containing protein [Alphaproteobacteria bacterium]
MAERMRTKERQFDFTAKLRVEELRPEHTCEAPGCGAPAPHRAPKSRMALGQYRWFCLDHVREYNQSWNYFAGMSDAEIWNYQKAALTGHRPTWGLGDRHARPAQATASLEGMIHDVFTLLDDGPSGYRAHTRPEVTERKLTKLQEDSLAVLGLEGQPSLNEIKARYKELVKRYHPDVNGGDRGAEERLQRVIAAYGILKSSGLR